MEDKTKVGSIAFGAIGIMLIIGLLLYPAFSTDNTMILVTGSNSNSTSGVSSVNAGTGLSVNQTTGNVLVTNTAPDNTVCTNVGTGSEIYKDGECNFRTLGHGSGITLTNGTNVITVNNSGVLSDNAGTGISVNQTTGNVLITNTAPDNTACTNVGTGSQIYKDGECNFRTLTNGNGIGLTQNTNDVAIRNTGVLSDVAGTGISVNQTTGNVLITNTSPESTSASNVGNGANVFKNMTSAILYFKTILAGTGISITNGTNTITITNSLPESTSGVNVGNGANLFKNQTGTILYYKTLLAGTGISVTNSTNTITFTNIGVTSITASTPLSASASTGAVTLSCTYCFYGNMSRNNANIVLSTGTPTIVQNTFNTASTGTTVIKTFTSNVVANNLIIACELQGVNVAPTAPTDNGGLTWTQISNTATSTNDASVCYGAMAQSSASLQITGHYGTTCTTTRRCILFTYEISGSDVSLLYGANGGSAGSTTPATSSLSFTNTPLLIGVYVHETAGTVTAGANFALSNGESGSIQYLSEHSTSLTSTSTTFPATFGTSSTWGGSGIVVPKATTIFSISLAANTNYVFDGYVSTIGSAAASSAKIEVHSLGSGNTLQMFCQNDGSSTTNSLCVAATDTVLTHTVSATNNIPVQLFGTVKVGSTATTLLIEYGIPTSATNNLATINAGSWIRVQVVA